MPDPLNITRFRAEAGPVFSDVVHHHRPRAIRRGSDVGMLVGAEELDRLLEPYEFHPEVSEQDGMVSIWLPEFEIYGQGESFRDAAEDLVDEIREYVAEYRDNIETYRVAPNRKRHLPFVIKADLADANDQLPAVLFAPPSQARDRVPVEVEQPLIASS